MTDQAQVLRELVRRQRDGSSTPSQTPRIAMVGGKGGVGTTTIAVALSIALARRRPRVVLVDTNVERADTATLCGLSSHPDLTDVLGGRRPLESVLRRGPAGLLVAAGPWNCGLRDDSPAAVRRLARGLEDLRRHADCVVLDAGCGRGDWLAGTWRDAEQIVVVTTPEPLCIVDAYRFIKSAVTAGNTSRFHCLVNRAAHVVAARDVYGRLAYAAQRFLGVEIHEAGHVPDDPQQAERVATGGDAGESPWPAIAALADRLIEAAPETTQTRRPSCDAPPPVTSQDPVEPSGLNVAA